MRSTVGQASFIMDDWDSREARPWLFWEMGDCPETNVNRTGEAWRPCLCSYNSCGNALPDDVQGGKCAVTRAVSPPGPVRAVNYLQ